MSTYVVQVDREGDGWTAEVEGLEGAQTWGKGIRHLMESVREAIILAADLPDDAGFDLRWEITTGDPQIDELASGVRARRIALRESNQQLVADTERLVAALVAAGYSIRDAASISGVSRARVGQLVSQS